MVLSPSVGVQEHYDVTTLRLVEEFVHDKNFTRRRVIVTVMSRFHVSEFVGVLYLKKCGLAFHHVDNALIVGCGGMDVVHNVAVVCLKDQDLDHDLPSWSNLSRSS